MSQAQRGNRALRAIDAVLGVPIVMTLSLMRSKSGPPKAPQTIGIVVLGALGDALLTSALVAGIRKTFPNGQIVVFGTRSNQQAFELITGFDRRIEVSLSNPFKALLEVRKASCDCMIDTSQWSRFGAILSALSGARYTIGFQTHGQFRHFAYDDAIVHRATCHEIENFQALGAPLGQKVHALPCLNHERINALEPEPSGLPFVVFHPWASGTQASMREWPLESWALLIMTIIQSGFDVVLSGGPEDQSKSSQLIEFMNMRFPKLVDLIAQKVRIMQSKSLLQTAAILQRAAAIVSVNTGIMHLAALLDRPLVALHGPTNPVRWGPQYPGMQFTNPPVVLAVSTEQGGGFLHLGFEYGSNHQYVMQQITVTQVVEALHQLRLPVQTV